MAVALATLGDGIALPFASPAQRALSGVWFMAVLSRICYLGQYAGHLRNLLTEQRARLTIALDEVERLANRDELTGVMNRRAIMRLVGEERDRMQRTTTPFAVALFDVDLFKRVNDEHGHLVGDEVLRRFSDVAAGAIRAVDRIGRIGGEEFLVLMPATDAEDAAIAAAERIREALGRVDWTSLDSDLGVTVSAGVAVARAGDTVEALIGRADIALYVAKREGRDRIRAG
jgi:diguanylate cyclase